MTNAGRQRGGSREREKRPGDKQSHAVPLKQVLNRPGDAETGGEHPQNDTPVFLPGASGRGATLSLSARGLEVAIFVRMCYAHLGTSWLEAWWRRPATSPAQAIATGARNMAGKGAQRWSVP